jgi:hypothetical protein
VEIQSVIDGTLALATEALAVTRPSEDLEVTDHAAESVRALSPLQDIFDEVEDEDPEDAIHSEAEMTLSAVKQMEAMVLRPSDLGALFS